MSYDLQRLNGRVIEVCGTQAEFAKRMGLSERTISLKLNGHIYWKQDEINKAIKVLGLKCTDITSYFFRLNVSGG